MAMKDLCQKSRIFYDCTSTYILWSVLGVRSNFFVNLMVVITGLEKASVPLGIQGQLAMKQYLRRFPIQAHRKDAQP